MRRPAIAVIAAGLVAITAILAWVLSRSDYRTLDSNRVGKDDFVVEIPAGRRACQAGETVPAGAGRLRLTIADRNLPTPRVGMTLVDTAGREIASGQLRPGWKEGVTT